LTSGKIEDPAPVIREKFGSRYIFSDAKENEDMIAKCFDSGWCEMAYEDDEAIFLKIRDAKGEPPNDATEIDAPPTAEELKQLEEEEKAANAKRNANDEDEKN
jgi:predicted  nucleic acid-binding Zn-ribbon protein